jgi:acyl-CoA thioesterase FadM
MTRHIEVDYLRPVPLGQPLTLTGRHTGTTGRRNHTEAQLADANGRILATAKAVFVTITPDLLAKVKFRQAQQ